MSLFLAGIFSCLYYSVIMYLRYSIAIHYSPLAYFVGYGIGQVPLSLLMDLMEPFSILNIGSIFILVLWVLTTFIKSSIGSAVIMLLFGFFSSIGYNIIYNIFLCNSKNQNYFFYVTSFLNLISSLILINYSEYVNKFIYLLNIIIMITIVIISIKKNSSNYSIELFKRKYIISFKALIDTLSNKKTFALYFISFFLINSFLHSMNWYFLIHYLNNFLEPNFINRAIIPISYSIGCFLSSMYNIHTKSERFLYTSLLMLIPLQLCIVYYISTFFVQSELLIPLKLFYFLSIFTIINVGSIMFIITSLIERKVEIFKTTTSSILNGGSLNSGLFAIAVPTSLINYASYYIGDGSKVISEIHMIFCQSFILIGLSFILILLTISMVIISKLINLNRK